VIVVCKADAVVEEVYIKTYIELFVAFPCQQGVAHIVDGLALGYGIVEIIIISADSSLGVVVTKKVVTRYSIAASYFHEADGGNVLHKVFAANRPASRYGGEITPLFV